ncbi:MAG: hypothetical protein ABEJ31_10215 [Haloarculaceae archaeon]
MAPGESASVTAEDVDALLGDLEDAASAHERARERVAERDEAELQRVAETYRELESLFDRYEDRATGDEDFQAFIEFQEELAAFVDHLAEDLPHRERFEEVDELLQQRRLTDGDFAQAREVLSPVADDVARLEERDATRRRYRDLRERAERRGRELDERIAHLADLTRLGEADLDAPVERLREPLSAYDEAATDAFAAFKRDASAREVLAFVEAITAFPLVPFREPPADLRAYVREHEAGAEPIPQLLEYAEYSNSKLDHYVADADALKRAVATNLTYLRRLDGEPLTIGWPPPSADELRWRVRELVQALGRFAPEDVVARARALRSLSDDLAYDRLRESARARSQLTDEQRERLASGAIDRELDQLREKRAELDDRLGALPAP